MGLRYGGSIPQALQSSALIGLRVDTAHSLGLGLTESNDSFIRFTFTTRDCRFMVIKDYYPQDKITRISITFRLTS